MRFFKKIFGKPGPASVVKPEPSELNPATDDVTAMFSEFSSLMQARSMAQQKILEFEKTGDPKLLDEMRELKATCQRAAEVMYEDMDNLARIPLDPESQKELLRAWGGAVAQTYRILGGLSLYLKEYAEAWDLYDKAREIADKVGEIVELVSALNNLGTVAYEQGDFDVALDLFRQAESRLSEIPPDAGIRKYVNGNLTRTTQLLSKGQSG